MGLRINLNSWLLQVLQNRLHDLLNLANPESAGQKGPRDAQDAAFLLSTTGILESNLDDDGFDSYTFPIEMQGKQPPSYDKIPALEQAQKGKRKKSMKQSQASNKAPSPPPYALSLMSKGSSCLDLLHAQPKAKIGNISGEQDAHLDGLIDAIFALMSLTRGRGSLGIVLNSAEWIYALKNLSREEFVPFRQEFYDFLCPGDPEGRKLIDMMPGKDKKLKLRAAWRLYAVRKLSAQGYVEKQWKRAYVEMEEGVMAICSMSLLHFGTRFPLYFDNRPVPDNLWHLRLHMYVGSKLRPRLEGEGALLDQVQDSTVDIHDYRDESDWISAAQHFYRINGITY